MVRQLIASQAQLQVINLGQVAYEQALFLQQESRNRLISGLGPEVLLLCSHDPVYTIGRSGTRAELLRDDSFYHEQGIAVCPSDRGGRVTYHGPGQLVGYPIIRVSDPVAYLRLLEEMLIEVLDGYGVAAYARNREGSDYTGVWTDRGKIAAIGVHFRRGVVTHGFALNVDMDMEPWQWLSPCGLTDPVTSLAEEGGQLPSLDELSARVTEQLKATIGLTEAGEVIDG